VTVSAGCQVPLTKVPSGAFSPTVLRWQARPTSATLARPEPSSSMLLLLMSLRRDAQAEK
jgi:hypothetical protein